MNATEAKKVLLTCPGDTIEETIQELGMSQAELAERLGRSIPKLNELVKGKAPITKETATKLEYVLGVPAGFWLNLERAYQDELLAIEKMDFLESCTEWVKDFPIKFLKELKLLPDTNNKLELAENLLKFFRVASPEQWANVYKGSSVAFKIDLKRAAEPEALSVWLRLGEMQAENIQTVPFDKKLIRERIKEIQELSFYLPPNWMRQLQQICADCGIALVYTPCILKAPIYGATRWIKNNSIPLIQITDRRKDNNAFWFTFYHELAHIIFHGKREIFIDGLESIEPDAEKEMQADEFASRMLLSEGERNHIFKQKVFTPKLIKHLSEKYKKHPGIIVSQLQREGLVKYNNLQLNSFREKIVFDDSLLNL